jgi:hypothetical protein
MILAKQELEEQQEERRVRQEAAARLMPRKNRLRASGPCARLWRARAAFWAVRPEIRIRSG